MELVAPKELWRARPRFQPICELGQTVEMVFRRVPMARRLIARLAEELRSRVDRPRNKL